VHNRVNDNVDECDRDEAAEADKYQKPERDKREDEAAASGARYCIMKMLNTSLEPIPLGKNIIIGLAEEFRERVNPRAGDEVTCEETKRAGTYCDNCDSCDDDRGETQGSHEPFSGVMVVEDNPQKTVKQSIEYINKEVIKGPRDETGVIAETSHRNRKPRERISDAVSSSRTSVEAIKEAIRDKVRHLELKERAMMISVLQ
jgi:hypothetical protein